jgi:hypothetical protein
MTSTMQPRLFVLVLMPFSEEFLAVYANGIKPACEDAGAYCERLDEQIFQETIISRIYNQIAKADTIVADMSGLNPNVFYEAGYAHALGKEVVLLTNSADDIPYDLKHYTHVVYEGDIPRLKTELGKRIAWLVSNPKKSLDDVESFVDLHISGRRLDEEMTIESEQKSVIRLKIDIHNPRSKIHEAGKISLGILTSEAYDASSHSDKVVSLPTGGFLHLAPPCTAIFPEGWDSIRIKLISNSINLIREEEQLTLRVFTELGFKDYRVKVVFA